MEPVTQQQFNEVVANFKYEGKLISITPYGSGHINDTYLLVYQIGMMGTFRVILQRLNKEVFIHPDELMENIIGVTRHLRQKIVAEGGNPERETLNLIPARNGELYYIDSKKDYWRSYIFITDATSYDIVEKPEHFYESAVAFGKFQRRLADYPATTLHETIKGFHNTRTRLAAFRQVVSADKLGLAKSVKREISFVLEREAIANYLVGLQEQGDLPIRVTHNDTKLNNIMMDNKTGKGLCVIDLDTVMPGLAINDFGDSIRFGASTATEDEPDLSKVECSMDLFSLYTRGFIKGCRGMLTRAETELLPTAAKTMTYECGMRFLTDYLNGDVYFKVQRKNHNLDRCRTQFKLVADMERKWDTMNKIVSYELKQGA